MDWLGFFLLRYGDLHGRLVEDLLAGLSEDQVRRRPDPRVNTIAWLLWHAARIEDVGVNGLVADRPIWKRSSRWSASDASRSRRGRWRRRPRGSPTSGAAAGAASGSCPRHRSCTSTGITSRRGWSKGSGASGAREAHPEDPGEPARQEVDDRREPAAPCCR